jgi:prophage tail gpP-like protein
MRQGDDDEFVNVQIDKKYFANWVEVEIVDAIDNYTQVRMVAPFEPDKREFRDLFRPFTYQEIEVDSQLTTLFKGFIVDPAAKFDFKERTVEAHGYAKPAVSADSDMPVALLTDSAKKGKSIAREFTKLGIYDIAKACLAPFGIGVRLEAPEGKPFDKVRIEPDKKIQEFLVELAKQRNLVLSNTVEGELLIWQSVDPGAPVCRFIEGKAPLTTVEPSFSPREYYSEITGFAARKRGKAPAKWTEQNPFLPAPLRANTFKLEDTERADAPEATRAKLGRMFANMASYTIPDLPTWRDPNGQRWRKNTTVTVLAPSAMIYQETEFLIRNVKLKATKEGRTATLELALPGAFNGKVPERLPWSEPT